MARNVARNSAQRPGSHGGRVVRGFWAVESSVRSNRSFERVLGALKLLDPKFRVSIYLRGGDRVVRWFPLTEPA